MFQWPAFPWFVETVPELYSILGKSGSYRFRISLKCTVDCWPLDNSNLLLTKSDFWFPSGRFLFNHVYPRYLEPFLFSLEGSSYRKSTVFMNNLFNSYRRAWRTFDSCLTLHGKRNVCLSEIETRLLQKQQQ